MSRRNWLLFFLVGLLWGIPYLLMKVAVRELSPALIVFDRVFIGSLVLIPIAIKRKTLAPAFAHMKYISIYAVGEMILPWILITSAEKKVSSGLAGLLVSTVPIWSTIMSSFNGDKSVWHHKRLFGLVLGFIGLVLVVGIESFSGNQSLMAIGMILLASVGYAASTVMVNVKIPHVDGIAINGVAMVITAVVYLPFAIINWPSHVPSGETTLSLIALGLFPTAMAFIYFFQLMKSIGPARSSLVTYLNTAFAVLLGVILLHEPLTVGIMVGLPLVLVGSYFASRKSAPAA
jgi:drug/metabolite transporter (DMT)-like permease